MSTEKATPNKSFSSKLADKMRNARNAVIQDTPQLARINHDESTQRQASSNMDIVPEEISLDKQNKAVLKANFSNEDNEKFEYDEMQNRSNILNKDETDQHNKQGNKRSHESDSDASGHQDEDDDDDDEGVVVVENTMGKVFKIALSEEVKTYVRELAEQCHTDLPPTVSKLKMITCEALEQLLKYNDRPVYGSMTKHQLAAMVLDYMKSGCPPRCPKCKKGALRFSNGIKKYGKRYFWCPGSTTNGKNFYGCNFKAERDELDRIPWKTPP